MVLLSAYPGLTLCVRVLARLAGNCMVHFVYFTLANLFLHNILLLVIVCGFVGFVCNIPTNSSPLAPIKPGPNRLDARRRSVAITGVRAHNLTANALPACGRDLVGSLDY